MGATKASPHTARRKTEKRRFIRNITVFTKDFTGL
jgi:hypothetical protein